MYTVTRSFQAVCCSWVQPRFFAIVVLALVVNVVIAIFIVQKRASGTIPRYLLNLMETVDCGLVLL